jgi:hypothetical protein
VQRRWRGTLFHLWAVFQPSHFLKLTFFFGGAPHFRAVFFILVVNPTRSRLLSLTALGLLQRPCLTGTPRKELTASCTRSNFCN